MSVATVSEPRVRPVSRAWKAGDLAALPVELDGLAVKYELFDGELIVMAPPGGEHARKQAVITRYLITEAESRGLGITFSEVGIVLRRNPDRIVGADAAFVLKTSLPLKYTPEGYLTTIPEIIVEIQSKNDTDAELRSKIQEYLAVGAKEIWWIQPAVKTVTICSADGSMTPRGTKDVLESDLLPGVAVSVSSLLN